MGAILTGQAGWQIFVAGYYVFVDVLLDVQYFWYTWWKSPKERGLVGYGSGTGGSDNGSDDGILVGISPPNGGSTGSPPMEDGKSDAKILDKPAKPRDSRGPPRDLSTSLPKEKEILGSSSRNIKRQGIPAVGSSPRTLLMVSMLCVVLTTASPLHLQIEDKTHAISSSESVGRVFSWCSTVLYLGSRLPQIYKNASRRSTDGLSPALFLAAFFGNFFYSASMMTNPLAWKSYPPYGLHGWVGPEGSDRNTWRGLAAPFWLGAAGVLVLDATIGLQFLRYGEGGVKKAVLVRDGEGRSRWRRVGGWMRGWVPSPSPSMMENVDGDEARRLLNRRESLSSYGAT